jgi:hypothetical protein
MILASCRSRAAKRWNGRLRPSDSTSVLPAHPSLDALTPWKSALNGAFQGGWPETTVLSQFAADALIKNSKGEPITFVAPSNPPLPALRFEQRIHERGEVETRPQSWHDLFHACVWLTFPRSKARINALHVEDGAHAARNNSQNRRSALRNKLTLLDEGGLIIACSNPLLINLLCGFRWHELFWNQRVSVREQMDFVVFGHALYERVLNLHYGSIGHGVIVPVKEPYFALNRAQRLAFLDDQLQAQLAQSDLAATPFQPVPLKGIPGWALENEEEAYYFDKQQFRDGRRVKK